MKKGEVLVHYHPRKGWLNDPNGLYYTNGEYRMYYQYHPNSTIWGPMHWGYTVSKDLVKWKEGDIALYPDELGYIFSGSGILDKKNVSELFDENIHEEERVILFYTNHLENNTNENEVEQMQSMAYSIDNGKNYIKYDKNPIICGKGRKDFRDPKVFYYEKTNKWIMVVSAGIKLEFYESKNLKDWSLAGEFFYNFGYKHIWECPDLIFLSEKWILIASIINEENRIESEVVYFVGEFNGNIFIPDEKMYELLDEGKDYYAPQTWSNLDKRISIAWANNWVYAREIPSEGYRGIMGLPRELQLKNNKLIQKKVNTFEKYLGEKNKLKEKDKMGKNVYLELDILGDFNIDLFKDKTGSFKIKYIDKKLEIERGTFGNYDFNNQFVTKKEIEYKIEKIDILIDKNIIEIFINGGEKIFTYLVYPERYNYELTGNIKGNIIEIKN